MKRVLTISFVFLLLISGGLWVKHQHAAQYPVIGNQSRIVHGSGTPAAMSIACASDNAYIPYMDDNTNNFWNCNGTAWTDISTIGPATQPPDLTATGTIPAATVVVSGCSATATVNVTGAVVGKRVDVQNTDGTLPAATSVYQGSVTSAGVVTIRQCAFVALVMASRAVTVTVGQ